MKNGILITTADNEKEELKLQHSRSRLKRNIVVAVLSIFICILTAVLLYLLFSVSIDECTSPTCVRSSVELLQHIDPKADPCEDFYLFSCGNFLQNTNLDNRGSRSVSNVVEDEIQSKVRSMLEQPVHEEDKEAFRLAKKFYRACTNESAIEIEGLTKMRQIFWQVGGWPTLDGNGWKESQFEWEDAICKLRRMGINCDFFFRVTLDINKKDEKKYILGVHDIHYSPAKIRSNSKNMYLDYMVDVAVLFGAKLDTARNDMKEVIGLLLKLAKISEESAVINKTGLYEEYTMSELRYNYPGIPWESYLNSVLAPVESITYDDTVVISEPLYLNRLMKVLEDTPKRTLANFIAWQSLHHLINYLPRKVLDRAYEYLGKVNGKMIMREPRWVTCIKATQERMDSVVAAAFIEHFFSQYSRNNIAEMILNIKIQFKDNLKRLHWMDEKSKSLTIEQLLKNVEDIGSYSDLVELHLENQAYEEAHVYENRPLESALNLDLINQNLKFSKLRKPVKENWMGKSSFVTGIYVLYFAKENILRFPIGIFGGVYYQDDRPKYMNYGTLGSIIAHEISHIFIKARDGDRPGDLRSRWSIDSLLKYDERVQCLSAQYENFEIPELDKYIDPQKTRDEDMADLAGIKIAYDTYVNWIKENGAEPRLPALNYSPNQLFWISSAIRHCGKFSPQTMESYVSKYRWSPPQFRVNGPLRNLEDFATDFGCPTGAKMNPEKKCFVW